MIATIYNPKKAVILCVYLDSRGIQESQINTEEVKKQLNSIQKAYASGVLRVQYSDRFVVYRSLEEMEKIIHSLQKKLGIQKTGFNTLKIVSSKGL